MKEKIRALWAKIAPKVEPILLRFRTISDRVLPHIKKHIRWASYGFIIPIGFIVIAAFGFFSIYPAYELRPWITQKLVTRLRAQSLRIGDMKWDHSLSQMSLGVALSDIEIQKGAWFNTLKFEELRLSFSPLALFSMGTPFNLEAEGMDADLELRSPRLAQTATSAEIEAKPSTKQEQLVEWTQELLSHAKGYKIRVQRSRVRLDYPVKARKENEHVLVQVSLRDIELKAELDASWKQNIELKGVLQAGTDSGSWVLAGPIELDTKSVLTVKNDNVPVALNFREFNLDLSKTNFNGWGVLERFSPGRFAFEAKPQVIFKEEGSHLLIGDITSGQANAFLDDLKFDVSLHYQPGKDFEASWLVGRSEVEAFHLPLRWIRRAPGRGIITTTGRLHVRDRLDNSDFSWRLSLNNFKFDSSHLGSIWGDKNSAAGEVLLSAVSEGQLQNGKLDSPRTEIQIDASAMRFDPPEAFFVKPAENKAQLLLRMSHDAEGLKISNFDLELHSLKAEGRGAVKNLLGYIADEESAKFDLSVVTNNIDLAEWGSFFPSLRKVPLQGFFQAKGNVSGSYDPLREKPWSDIDWNIEKFHLSNIKGSFEGGSGLDVSGMRQDLSGPFDMSFFFVGRGQSTKVHRATLLSQVDLSGAAIWINEKFRKPQGVPLVLQVSAEQSRNRLKLERGNFRFANLDMNFSGDMIQGMGRSRLKVLLRDPVDLASWKDFFPDARIQDRVKGKIWLDGSLGLDSNFESEKDIDWSTVTFEGQSRFENFAWHSDIMGDAFDSISGKVIFSDKSIQFSPVDIRRGAQSYRLDGTLVPQPEPGKKQRSLYFIDWFMNPAWNLTANVQIPHVELSSLLKKLESKDRYTLPDEWLDSKWAKQSRANLNLDIATIHWENKELFSKLLGKFEYDQGRSTLRPFSLVYRGGKVKGSATLDVTPVWKGDSDPQWAASVSVEDFGVEALPFQIGFSKGVVKGDATFTSQGRYFSDWEKSARLRGLVNIASIQGSTWMKSVKDKVDIFFDKSDASDYLLSDAKRSDCMPSPESALVEFQRTSEKLSLGRMRISLKGGGRLDLQADVSKPSHPEESKIRGKALYRFPTKCFSPRAQYCVQQLQNDTAWPLDFSQSDRTWSRIEYEFDPAAFGKSFQLCMERKVSSDVKSQISAEASKRKVPSKN